MSATLIDRVTEVMTVVVLQLVETGFICVITPLAVGTTLLGWLTGRSARRSVCLSWEVCNDPFFLYYNFAVEQGLQTCFDGCRLLGYLGSVH